MRLPALLIVPALLLALTSVRANEELAEPKLGSEARYLLALKAYRGELNAEQLAALQSTDPGPSIYLDSERPSERALVRLFATLPDEAHARLRQDGVLKWKVNALPQTQREWVGDLAAFLEGLGEGPYPTTGRKPAKRPVRPPLPEPAEKADPNATQTGFVRVDVAGQDEPCYSWWIDSPGAKRPAWLTLVNANGLATREWQASHRLRLKEIESLPESPAVPADRWQKYREPKRVSKPREKPAPVEVPHFFEDAVYEAALKVYRGRRAPADLAALKPTDPDIESRLKSSDVLARAARSFFTRLSEKDHETLRTEGTIRWYSQELSKEHQRLVQPALDELNRRSAEAGEGDGPYSLAKFSGTCVGFSILEVPGAEGLVLSWWVRSRSALNPTWVTLINTAAAKQSSYYRAHLIAIGSVQ